MILLWIWVTWKSSWISTIMHFSTKSTKLFICTKKISWNQLHVLTFYLDLFVIL